MSNNLNIDKELIGSRYPALPFGVRHNLASHPLFQIERLLELQRSLPDHKVDYYTGKVGVNEDRTKAAATGLTAEQTIRDIRGAKSWLVLKNVELDPTYRELVMDCLEELRPMVEKRSTGMRRYQGWIFITSPGSVAPYHLDPEHNFLLQIHGPKTVHVWDPTDRTIISEEELENYYSKGAAIAKLEYSEEYQKKVYEFKMMPGDGVYIPVSAPHWVKVEEGDFSISFSITYYCDEVYRRDRMFRFNAKLRKMGLKPTPYEQPGWRNTTKDAIISTFLKTRGLFGAKESGGRL